jgi:hypothetical protein
VTVSSLYRQNKKRDLREKYQNSAAWRQFTDKICQSVAVKRALHESQAGRCASCRSDITSRTLDDCTVHHLSYDHRCTFGGNATPNLECATCLAAAPRKAEACLALLVLLHTACHYALHKAEKRDPTWRRAMGLEV